MNFEFDQGDFWKLFIDASRWPQAKVEVAARGGAHPALLFDLEEPGYFHGMIQGYKVAMDFSRPLSKELIRDIHDAAVEPVYVLVQKKRISLGWRREPTWFYIIDDTSTPQGIEELKQKCKDPRYNLPGYGNLFERLIERIPEKKAILTQPSTFPGAYFRFRDISQELITAAVDHLLNLYWEEIKSEGEELKIQAIARLIQNLNQAHPFFDGNVRTFGILLLNRLLLENGLTLCCFSNPNCLDLVHFSRLVELVKEGQQNFLKISEGYKITLEGVLDRD